ncbi:MAG: hypothetical protein M3137_19805, partial [Actinomycetota bacterium]|nr:hypothetical protein [Actinomycetota bacterium]
GYADSQKPLANVAGLSRVYGGTIPAKAWHDFMVTALAGSPPTAFVSPPAPNTKPEVAGALGPGPAMTPRPIGGNGAIVAPDPTPPTAVAPSTVPSTTTTLPPDFGSTTVAPFGPPTTPPSFGPSSTVPRFGSTPGSTGP